MGERVNEVREMAPFTSISMRGIGKLTVSQGKPQEFRIEGGEAAAGRVTNKVLEGKLIIDVGRDWIEKISAGFDYLSAQDVHIFITVPELEEVEVTGAAEVTVNAFKTDSLSLKMVGASNLIAKAIKAKTLRTEIPGAGRMVVDGEVKDLSVTLAGAGNFSGHDLASKTAKVVLSGVGSVQLWVADELDVTIAGVGSVEYYGEPHIKQSVAMLGKVTSMGKKG